jgi:hypothetical protein
MTETTTGLPDWRAADRTSRDRLREVGSRLQAIGAGETRLADGWTAAATIAHIGVWDSMMAARWRDAHTAGRGVPDELPRWIVDLVNAGTLPLLGTLSIEAAAVFAERGASELAEVLAGVDEESLLEAYRVGRSNLVDRSRHRAEHLDAIEAALG